MLEAQPLHRVVEFDVDAEIVGIELELVVAEAASLIDIHDQIGDVAVALDSPMAITGGIGLKIDCVRRHIRAPGTLRSHIARLPLRDAGSTLYALFCIIYHAGRPPQRRLYPCISSEPIAWHYNACYGNHEKRPHENRRPRASAKAVAKPADSRETDAYLRRLGERVRTLRNQRGMTRKALAQHAKVSERYLAQLEAGLGNGSIVLLRRIARAIGLPVTQLVNEGAEPALDFVLLSQFLERLSPLGARRSTRTAAQAFR